MSYPPQGNGRLVALIEDVQIDVADVQTTADDILEEVEAVEHHLHNRERWLGARAGWDGTNETNAASNDRVADFQIDAGNDTWGAAKCILGSGDTPVISGKTLFDLHRVMVSATERNSRYRIRFAWGTSYAAGISAGTFTEIEFVANSFLVDAGPADIIGPQLAAGTKIFAACWADGQATGTIDFTIGLHEYD